MNIYLVCESCGNKSDFIEETTTVWDVDSDGERTHKRSETLKFTCEKCKRKVVPYHGKEL